MFVFLFYFHQYAARCIFLKRAILIMKDPHYFAEKSDVKSEPRNGDKPIFVSMKEQKYSCLKQ
jgi:hypothetical protein